MNTRDAAWKLTCLGRSMAGETRIQGNPQASHAGHWVEVTGAHRESFPVKSIREQPEADIYDRPTTSRSSALPSLTNSIRALAKEGERG